MIDEDHQKLADEKELLAREMVKNLKELKDINLKKIDAWLIIRAEKGVKSDKQADRLWTATEDGRRELELEYENKGIKLIQSSVNTKLRIKNAEMYGQC